MSSPQTRHHQIVTAISGTMRIFFQQGKKVRMYHGGTNSTRPLHPDTQYVDVSQLNQVLSIDPQTLLAEVEANVSMDVLLKATLAHGLMPKILPEFPGITVAGAIQGGAAESSSYKYGLFHDICLQYEMVLGNGEIVTASPTENADLYYATACAYGTLGIITKATLQLQPAKKYVSLTYLPVQSFQEAVEVINQTVHQPDVDFVDGLLFSEHTGTVMVGRLTTDSAAPRKTFLKPTDDWFYLHAQKVSGTTDAYQETIPLKDYLFRYDRGAFWMGKYFFEFVQIPFTRLARTILAKYMTTRMLYRMLHAANASQRAFAQDISLPSENTQEFLTIVDQKLGIYPLWLCPLLPSITHKDQFSPVYTDAKLVINVGVYGKYRVKYEKFVSMNRFIEAETARLGGRKVLYAHAYYTREEFWDIYNEPWYNHLRSTYHATTTFPDIYDKVAVKQEFKPDKKGIIRGLLQSPFRQKIARK